MNESAQAADCSRERKFHILRKSLEVEIDSRQLA